MINIFKERWQVIADIALNHPIIFLLSIVSIFACVALVALTFYMAGKYEILKYPFFILVAILLLNFYVDVAIWTINLFK
ncbi:hypothetical protein [Acinetobacter sp. SWAC57]|uniref:hypothetical protein n=1 Tax=Acinetobacter sp. SWAC57 TaxID=2293834 RepID=UPI000E5C204F|nr:hypothetical protein [Acinetobacter sp. SWAC57]RGD93364.1 hypothetical protein DYI96_00545 [Acinetobacter sp. SWAC57]